MAADSPIKAAIDLYNGLSAANFPGSTRPAIYFDEGPQYDGGQVRPPYVILKDSGVNTEMQAAFEASVVDNGEIVLEIYADTLTSADLIAKCIRWNGNPPGSKLGFDFGTLALASPFYHMSLHRKSEQRSVAGIGASGQRTHLVTMRYSVMSGVSA